MDTSRQDVRASKEVFLDMKGACFLCLKGPSTDISRDGGGRVSLRDICRYLEVTELEVDGFSNNREGDFSSQREQLGFAVSLCEICSSEVNQLVGFIHELEEIQKRITRQLQQVHVILEGSFENDQPNQPWKKNLLTASLVGFLRNEAGQKCLEKIRNLGIITDAVPDVPASIQEPPTSTNQPSGDPSITSAETNHHQDFPESVAMEPAANPDSIPPAVMRTVAVVADVSELPVSLPESCNHLNGAFSATSAETNHLNGASSATSAEMNHLDFPSSAAMMEPPANPNSILSTNSRPQKKRRNILIISADEDVPVSLQESSTSSKSDKASSTNSVEIVEQDQDTSEHAEMEPLALSRSSSANSGPPRETCSQDNPEQTTWACQLEDGGCGKIFLRKAKLTNHQLNYCPKLKPKEEQPEMEEMDEDSDDSEFWSADSPPLNDGDSQLSPDNSDNEDCSSEAVKKIFAKNFRASGRQFQCLHCKRASGRTGNLRNVQIHLIIYHPETVFPSSKLPRLSESEFLTCLKELLRRETVAGKEEGKKKGKIAKDRYAESPLCCVECELTTVAGKVYRFHRISEHYGSLKKKLISLQNDFSRGEFSKLKWSVSRGQKRRTEVEWGGGKKYMAARGKTFPCAVEEGGCGKIFNVEGNLKRHKRGACKGKKLGRVVEGDGDDASRSSSDLAGGIEEEEIRGSSSSMECNQMEDSRSEDDDMFECEYVMVKSE